MKRIASPWIVCVLVLFWNGVALAQAGEGGGTVEWWQLLLQHLVELGFFVLTLLAVPVVRVLLKKWGFSEQSAKVNEILQAAVGFAEQKAIKAMKLTGSPTPSAEKMETAIGFAMSAAKEFKVAQRSQAWWEDRLEAWLGRDVAGA